MEGNGTSYTSDPSIFTWVLRNTNTSAGFYVLQHNDTSSTSSTTFNLNVNTTAGPLTLAGINLDGRQSKIVVTDYSLGSTILLYSTADIATYGIFGTTDVVVLYSEPGQASSFAVTGTGNGTYQSFGAPVHLNATVTNGITSYNYTQGSGASIVQFTNGTTFYLLDTQTAWRFWATPTMTNPLVEASEQVFVIGPYLVRSANITGTTVDLLGDNDNATTIEVYAGSGISAMTWNGQQLSTTTTPYGSLIGNITGTEGRNIALPTLTDWYVRDSLPEIDPSYDDSQWTICNHSTTLSPTPPLTYPVLFSSDYGFYTGIKVYRGRFDGANATAANLTAQGGTAFGWSVWLNGALVSSTPGNASLGVSSALIDFKNQTLNATDNLLTVVVDYTGHDETSTGSGVENPRGLLGASLVSDGANFTSWRIQGNAGGANGTTTLDPVRAPMNEGGLLAERQGWFLPGYPAADDANFIIGAPTDPGNSSDAGVKFYLTNFTLSLDQDLDVPLGVSFASDVSTSGPLRVQLFVNGYQYGKYVPHIGPQTVFPIPPGVINNVGSNTLGLTVWKMTDEGTGALDSVELVSYGAYQTGFEGGFAQDWVSKGYQPGWTSERLLYT